MKKTRSRHEKRRRQIFNETQVSFIAEQFKPVLEKLAPGQTCYSSNEFWKVSRKYPKIFNHIGKSSFKVKLKNTAVYTMAQFDASPHRRATNPDVYRFLDRPKLVERTDEEAAEYFIRDRQPAMTDPGLTEPTVGKEQPSATLNSRTSGFVATPPGPGTHFLSSNVGFLNSLMDYLEADSTRTEIDKIEKFGKEIYLFAKRQKKSLTSS